MNTPVLTVVKHLRSYDGSKTPTPLSNAVNVKAITLLGSSPFSSLKAEVKLSQGVLLVVQGALEDPAPAAQIKLQLFLPQRQ